MLKAVRIHHGFVRGGPTRLVGRIEHDDFKDVLPPSWELGEVDAGVKGAVLMFGT